ncbi:MAG: glucokinase [Candidatus Woesearchaeota archaeon]
MRHILAADIGGTNTRIALSSIDNPQSIIHYKHLKTSTIQKLEITLLGFLQEAGITGDSIGECIIACAGPVHNNSCSLTNSNLHISAKTITLATGITNVQLINDMQASAERIAEHLPRISKEKVIQNIDDAKYILLQDNYANAIEYPDRGVAMIIQAGTGYGLATLLTSKSSSILLSSESDHFPYAPYTQEEYEYYEYLRKKDNMITIGKILRNTGLYEYARFIGCKASTPEEVSLTYDDDVRAREAVHYYLKAHARYTAHFCNVFLPYRGVFITGNALTTNIKGILNSDYIGVMKTHLKLSTLQNIPVYLVEEHNINLKGALSLGKSKIESKKKIIVME